MSRHFLKDDLLPKEFEHLLTKDLSGSELQSFLIHVFSERAARINASNVLKSWTKDRFVQPSPLSAKDFAEFDVVAFSVASDFVAMELSPVCPLGTNISVAPMSQNKVLSTVRNTEVVADSTNVMALECAIRRKALLNSDPKNMTLVKLCASHRLLRTQKFSSPSAQAHFKVFTLCTAGRDTGSFDFEAKATVEHIKTYCRLFDELKFKKGPIIINLYGPDSKLISQVAEELKSFVHTVAHLGMRKSSYYPSISFKLNIRNSEGSEIEIGDGGITDWTQKLVSNSKERLMISGIGIDRLIAGFKYGQTVE